MMAEHVTSVNASGMCNRLKSLLSSMRLASRVKCPCYLSWPLNSACGFSYKSICDGPHLNVSPVPSLTPSDYVLHKGDTWMLDEYPDKSTIVIDSWRFLLTEAEISVAPCGIDFHFTSTSRLPIEAFNEYAALVRSIEWNANIMKTCHTYINSFFEDNIVGVHVRRTDHVLASSISPLDAFISRLDSDTDRFGAFKIYLATDAEDVVLQLTRRYGRRLLRLPGQVGTRVAASAGIRAVTELLLLSRTSRLYGSFGSTFTEMAWWLSGHKPITIPVLYNKKALASEMRRAPVGFYSQASSLQGVHTLAKG